MLGLEGAVAEGEADQNEDEIKYNSVRLVEEEDSAAKDKS